MTDYKVTEEQAIQEFERFINVKHVNQKKRDTYKESEEEIIEAIMLGVVTVDEDGNINQKLQEPLDKIAEVKYEKRLRVKEARVAFKTVDQKDSIGRMIAILCKVTNINNGGLWDQLDFADFTLAGHISNYFL